MKPSGSLPRRVFGSRPLVALASIALLPMLFVLDRYLPIGVAVGVLYVLPVLLTLWSPPVLTLLVAMLSSLLIAADVALSQADTVTWMALLNRGFSLAIVWLTAVLVRLRQSAERRALAAQASLEQKVAERTAHLAELNRHLSSEVTERERVERSLRESESHLRQIIDLVPHRIFVKDADSRFLLANRAVAEVYGMSVDALIGRRQADLHPSGEEVARMLADDRAVMESGEARVDYEETFTGPDGRQRILRTTKIPYRIQGEDRPAVLGMAMDITEERLYEQRLSASEQKYRALLENAVDAILLADAQGNLLDANRRAEELLGYSREELCRMHARDLHPPHEHAIVQKVFRTLASSGSTLVEHDVVRKDGSLLRVEVAAVLIRYGDHYVLQGIFRDVTERERRSKERLAQEQQHRDTLVREVHHRIKNNLQGVVGLLRQQASTHPELADLIGTAIGQVQSISVVYGLHGQGEDLEVRLCDMVSAIARNAGTLTRTRVEPEVQLAIRQPVQVNQDEAVPVALVINELILNAIKHGSAPSGLPEVRVVVDQQDGHAEVRVICNGQLPAGFDYPRGKGLGTGLGLVRSLLPHHGAELSFIQTDQQVEANLRLSPPVVRA